MTIDHAATGAPDGLGAFEGAPAFGRMLVLALRRAADDSARCLRWCDPDFAQWPLGEPAFVDLLTRWARGGARELVMIAGEGGTAALGRPGVG